MSILAAGVFLVSGFFTPTHQIHHGCSKTYTVPMIRRAANSVYSGIRHVSRQERRMLGRMEICIRNPNRRAFVHRMIHQKRMEWLARQPLPMAYPSAIASWYDDSGTTGCGFHTTYGIATFVVPCGGRVRLCHGSACVVATRDDSGPYIAGRAFDLNPTTKAQIGCSDLCDVRWQPI